MCNGAISPSPKWFDGTAVIIKVEAELIGRHCRRGQRWSFAGEKAVLIGISAIIALSFALCLEKPPPVNVGLYFQETLETTDCFPDWLSDLA